MISNCIIQDFSELIDFESHHRSSEFSPGCSTLCNWHCSGQVIVKFWSGPASSIEMIPCFYNTFMFVGVFTLLLFFCLKNLISIIQSNLFSVFPSQYLWSSKQHHSNLLFFHPFYIWIQKGWFEIFIFKRKRISNVAFFSFQSCKKFQFFLHINKMLHIDSFSRLGFEYNLV